MRSRNHDAQGGGRGGETGGAVGSTTTAGEGERSRLGTRACRATGGGLQVWAATACPRPKG